MEEANRCYTEAVRIERELDIPIERSYIDRGYCFASTMVNADSIPACEPPPNSSAMHVYGE